LSTSAKFLAKSLANEFDLRWRILEAEAESPRLRQLIIEANKQLVVADKLTPDLQDRLQLWLLESYSRNGQTVQNAAWVLMADEGTQVARVPRANSIGVNYRFRDYFHGQGRDLSGNQIPARGAIGPLDGKAAYVSSVYQGSNTETLMVTFAVPIWNAPRDDLNRERIGLIAFPVELGQFALGSNAIIADTRTDQISNRPGLVLHHMNLGRQTLLDELPYLHDTDLTQAKRLLSDRRATNVSSDVKSNIVERFFDPVEKRTRLAAIEPVLITGRRDDQSETLNDTGWLVIVTEDQ
jgi:hypothetical protein